MVIKGGMIMKKIIIAFAALAAAFSLVSCNKEQIETPSSALKLNITVADIGGAATKAVKTGWVTGDKINIWYDSNVTANPDLVIAYDGTAWSVDESATVSGAVPAASGNLKVVYVCGKTLASDFSKNDLTSVFNSPFLMFTLKTSTDEKIEGVNYAYDIPLISLGSTTYTYDENTLTASIDSWSLDKVNNCQTVITNLPEGQWFLRCDKLMPRRSFVLNENDFSASNPNPNEYVCPVDNEDGKAFYAYTCYTSGDFVFELYNIDTNAKYSFTATGKSLDGTGNKLNAIKIDFSKFAAI